MPTPIVPLHGELNTFGSGSPLVTFPRNHTYFENVTRKRGSKYAARLGQAYPVDILGGGVGPLTQPMYVAWYAIVGTTRGDVQAAYSLLEAQLAATNADGTSGEVNPLSVYAYDPSNTEVIATATVRIDDVSTPNSDRGPYHQFVHISFTCLTGWTY